MDQLLKENHPKLSAMDEMEKYIYIIMGLGAGFILFGAFFMAQELMEKCHTGYDRNDRVDACAAVGCICIRHHSPFTGSGMKKKQVKENDYMDMMIPGR